MSSNNLKIGWGKSRSNMCSGSMALQGLESQLLPRHLPRLPLQREGLVQVSSAPEILKIGVTFKQSSQHLHFNLHIGTPHSGNSCSKS